MHFGRLTGAAEGSHEKKLKLMQTEEIAAQEEHHMSWLLDRRMAAVMDAERKRAAALKSLAWLKEQPSEEELGTVEYWHGVLREMVATWEAQADGEEPETTVGRVIGITTPDAGYHAHKFLSGRNMDWGGGRANLFCLQCLYWRGQ